MEPDSRLSSMHRVNYFPHDPQRHIAQYPEPAIGYEPDALFPGAAVNDLHVVLRIGVVKGVIGILIDEFPEEHAPRMTFVREKVFQQ